MGGGICQNISPKASRVRAAAPSVSAPPLAKKDYTALYQQKISTFFPPTSVWLHRSSIKSILTQKKSLKNNLMFTFQCKRIPNLVGLQILASLIDFAP